MGDDVTFDEALRQVRVSVGLPPEVLAEIAAINAINDELQRRRAWELEYFARSAIPFCGQCSEVSDELQQIAVQINQSD